MKLIRILSIAAAFMAGFSVCLPLLPSNAMAICASKAHS